MKPDRIYCFKNSSTNEFYLTVPENKIWFVSAIGNGNVRVNLNGILTDFDNENPIIIFPGMYIANSNNSEYHMNIYEYSISGSGTDQGIDYIVP